MNDTNEILAALDDKKKIKTPSNGIWIAIVFADFVFILLDIGSGFGVYYVTRFWYYGVLVFVAGAVPLLLHQKLYMRAYASQEQKNASMIGIAVSILSVLAVAVFLGVVRFAFPNETLFVEVSLAVSLVLLAFAHALIMGYNFYIDEEVQETQKTHRMLARGRRNIQRVNAANEVARAKRQEVGNKRKLEKEYSPEVIAKILSMFADDDGDGIPNILDKVDNRRSFASEVEPPKAQGGQEPK